MHTFVGYFFECSASHFSLYYNSIIISHEKIKHLKEFACTKNVKFYIEMAFDFMIYIEFVDVFVENMSTKACTSI